MTLHGLLHDKDADYESDQVAEVSKVTNTLVVGAKNKPRIPNKHRRPRPCRSTKAKSVGPVRRHNDQPEEWLIPQKNSDDDDDGYASEPAEGPGIQTHINTMEPKPGVNFNNRERDSTFGPEPLSPPPYFEDTLGMTREGAASHDIKDS